MLEDTFPGFEAQIQAIKCSVMLFQHIHHSQGLEVVLKAPVILHAIIQRILPGVTEGRMAKVVRQREFSCETA